MFLDQASALYERATTGVLSKSMLLHFAYADFEEQNSRKEKVHQIYKKYLEMEDVDPTLVKFFFSVLQQRMHKMSRNYCRYPSSSCVKKVAFFRLVQISFLSCSATSST